MNETKTTSMTQDEFTKLRKGVACFHSLKWAQNYSDRDEKATLVLMGDFPEYWVARLAVAEKLIRAGYEVAPRI